MIRLMTPADIPAAMKLKECAGWNQTEQDWANVLVLEPEGCWVWEEENILAGSTTAICFGKDLAWIGMVLVLPEFRGRGIARGLMEQALQFLQTRGVHCVKLDATDMGRPLYLKLGFEDEAVIERWGRPAGLPPISASEAAPAPIASADDIAELDTEALGTDRRPLLQQLLAAFPGRGFRLPGGYLMTRPGANADFVGPCVADSSQTARVLIEEALRRWADRPFFWDLLPENPSARELASALGFECKRKLVRMALSGGACDEFTRKFAIGRTFAAAGFEYG
jgi:GNAT superfamily N-acetyltransferase